MFLDSTNKQRSSSEKGMNFTQPSIGFFDLLNEYYKKSSFD